MDIEKPTPKPSTEKIEKTEKTDKDAK